jgi:hypothetical protein
MTRDDSKALLRLAFMPLLDGGRPSGTRGWVNPVAPVVTQAAAGAGHWAAGRRQRALAEWAGAAGFGLVAWGLGTEAPTGAEALENLAVLAGMDDGQRRDFLRKLAEAPATAGTETPAARRVSRFFRWFGLVSPVAWMVIGVPWRLRHPRRLTALAIANEAQNVAVNVLRAARAVQRRRPRMAAGSALVAAGSVARLRAASAEPSGNGRPAAATAIGEHRENRGRHGPPGQLPCPDILNSPHPAWHYYARLCCAGPGGFITRWPAHRLHLVTCFLPAPRVRLRQPASRVCTTRLAADVVDVDDPAALQRHPLSDLMRIVGGRQPPVPTPRNCRTRASPARNRHRLGQKHRPARATSAICGYVSRYLPWPPVDRGEYGWSIRISIAKRSHETVRRAL